MHKSVLVVEDEFLVAMDLQLMLEDNGWRVIGPAPSVRDALRLLEADLPTVALLDVNLGFELVTPVAEALREQGVPFAVASAHDSPEQYGGPILAGVPNAGKPTAEHRLLDILIRLTAADS
jgi:DNA-binding response OmpR family regulator